MIVGTARIRAVIAGLATAGVAALLAAEEPPPTHSRNPPLFGTATPEEAAALADGAVAIEHDRTPARQLAEHRRLSAALASLGPQRPGKVDAYVVAVALDSDPVFAREAREAGRVLTRRYAAAGRSVTLAGSDGRDGAPLAMGSPAALATVLARVAELMDVHEDVLVLYLTAHGAPIGIVYNDGDQGYGAISPAALWTTLSMLGIGNRLVLVSACFSGTFVPMLASDTSVILTASSADRTSFGCRADNDWTFFGDAMVNHALRKGQPLARAAAEARATIAGWEKAGDLEPSRPQVSIGAGTARWLAALEPAPDGGAPVGRPATDALEER
ncbi:C13 family peptidase [Sphingomonas sp. KR1UV-12]|uniref:C13 family peptidase n=1 Tax=Sphingomonas aurea TaxID=3063994 RepID=A0ABT9EL82_9SPHN|nr:C13 family peptidase [Sphingomonas sp. KR1UV-12]MDP1027383.1 C13 family peptidase [Sphingomonas sp. KR1UV-12]